MTEATTIRIAETAERKELEALQRRASLNNLGDRDALLANPDAIEIPSEQITAGEVFVAERCGSIVGFAAVLSRSDAQIELDGLFVEPSNWKLGVGRSLVEHCGEFARTRGSSVLHVVGNPHAKDFYLACGFEVVGEQQTRFGIGLVMQKKL